MKKQLWIGLILILLIVSVVFWSKSSNQGNLFLAKSVPSFALINQNQQIITNTQMLGKVYLVEFFFTNCPTICPIMNQNLIKIANQIDHQDFGIISITIDPKRDTPEALKEHAQKLKINHPNWHFLTGDRDEIYKLSQEFNLYVGKDLSTAEGLNHTGNFALIDKNGQIRSRFKADGMPLLYYSGLNFADPHGKIESLGGQFHPQIDWLIEDIQLLLNK